MYGGFFLNAATPTENLTIDGAFSVMHSQYGDFTTADPSNLYKGIEKITGQMTRAPNSTENIGIEYSVNVPWDNVLGSLNRRLNLGPLRLRGEWFHTDYIIFEPYLPAKFGWQYNRQDPYSIFNFYASLPTEDEKWTLHFFAKNFTNTHYFISSGGSAVSYTALGGTPPWLGGDLTYRF